MLKILQIMIVMMIQCEAVSADAATDSMMARIAEMNLQRRITNLAKFRELYVAASEFEPPTQATVCAGGLGVCLVASRTINAGDKLASVENVLIDRDVVKKSFIGKVASSPLSDKGALAAYILHSRGEHPSIPAVHKAYVSALPIEVESLSRWKADELGELQDGGEVEAQAILQKAKMKEELTYLEVYTPTFISNTF